MDAFNFVASVFGLLLGFTLIELLAGFVRVVKRRRDLAIGFLSPALAAFVMMDLLSWWSTLWAFRQSIPVTYGVLLCGLVACGSYYFVASLVFPDDPDSTADFDAHYLRCRRVVLGGILLLNTSTLVGLSALSGRAPGRLQTISIVLYSAAILAALISRSKRVNAAMLAALIAIYFFWAIVA